MVDSWEGLPASPCTTHSIAQPTDGSETNMTQQAPKRHYESNPDPVLQSSARWKRQRTEASYPALSPYDGTSLFDDVSSSTDMETKTSAAEAPKMSATDERRKALLQRLQAIDKAKKDLRTRDSDDAAEPAPTVSRPVTTEKSASISDDDVILIEEKSTIVSRVRSPNDVKSAPSTYLSAPKVNKRKGRRPIKTKSSGIKPATVPSGVIIVVDDSSSSSSFPVKARKGGKKGKKSISTKSLPKPTRASTRVRRPRTLDGAVAESGEGSRTPTPVCMAKCKRFQFCKKLTQSLLKNETAAPFSAPVKDLWRPESIPRYFDVITTPMDLSTVRRNLETSKYITPCKGSILPFRFEVDKYCEDMRLIFRNAMVYNHEGDLLFVTAKSLLADFDNSIRSDLPPAPTATEVSKALSKKKSSEAKKRREKTRTRRESNATSSSSNITARPRVRRRSKTTKEVDETHQSDSEPIPETLEELSERLTYLRTSRPVVLSRTPLPKGSGYLSKASLLYNVEISHSQKRRCADVISKGKVSADKMEIMIDMLKSAVSSGAGDDDDDFELEFDKLDNKAWRNLEAFLEQHVAGFKTMRHSTLGREFSTVEQVDEEIEDVQNKMKKVNDRLNEEGEENMPSTPENRRSFFEQGAGESSSESESDSDSDSSDSDSDSDDE